MQYQHLPDEMLLNLLHQSDEKAFEEIYKRHWVHLFRYAITKISRQDIAEDICHDVFLSIWQRRQVLQVANLEAFLIQAVKYSIINYIKSGLSDKKLRRRLWENTELSCSLTESDLLFGNLLSAWNHAINRLPGKSRKIFKLSKIQNFSNKEVALRMNLSEKAVEYHITKALRIIRLHLREFIAMAAALLCLGYFF